MKYVIGVSAFYHDSSACLFKGDRLIFACEEEKFTGIKHDSSFPINTINYIFKRFKLSKSDIEMVCYYEDPKLKLNRVLTNIKTQWYKNPIYSLQSYFNIKKNIKDIENELSKISDNVFYSKHHLSHQYFSFYTSDFESAICLSIDGVGEFETSSVGFASNNFIETLPIAEYPHSLGLFYSAMTSFLGFKPNEGEYKVMGLASYGNYKTYINQVRELITYKNTALKCNMDYFTWDKSSKIMFNEKLVELLNLNPRLTEEKIESNHEDLAAAIQKRYEEIFFDILKSLSLIDGTTNLCLSGGCAYNGTANGKIIDETDFKKLWIPVAPSDAGSSVGACIHYLVKNKKLNGKVSKNPFIGPTYHTNGVHKFLKGRKYHKFYSDSKFRHFIANKLNEGKVIGWFNGSCEFGARALGNRSILANPTIDGMKDRINNLIKKREGFRPFAPMVCVDDQNKYFIMNGDVPYMNQIVNVKPEFRKTLTAVTHVDGTARVQSVFKHTQIYSLLKEFEKLSGVPILLNTSFNIKDKTMVLTHKDAFETFDNTDLDILVIDNFIILKNG
jgi:carbamoyltransferase